MFKTSFSILINSCGQGTAVHILMASSRELMQKMEDIVVTLGSVGYCENLVGYLQEALSEHLALAGLLFL